jgi:hypothetical protein
MPKALEKVPETVADLKTALPELCAQIERDAVATVDTTTPVTAAVQAERDRIFGILALEIGEEASASLSALVATGITVDQLTAIKALQHPTPAQTPAASSESAKKDQLLAAIIAAGATNAGLGGKGDQTVSNKDYMTLVDEYAAAHTCSRSDAMQAITRKHPDKHKEYIRKQNEGRA